MLGLSSATAFEAAAEKRNRLHAKGVGSPGRAANRIAGPTRRASCNAASPRDASRGRERSVPASAQPLICSLLSSVPSRKSC